MGLPTIGGAMMIGGGAASMFGSIFGGDSQSDAYRAMARQARKEAREARLTTDYRVRLIHEQGIQVLGGIEAETGKSGLALSGTPLQTLVDTARQVELSAALEKRAGGITAERTLAQGAAYAASASNAETAGLLGALGATAQIGMGVYALGGGMGK